jgi:ABC-type branched-subunit amino acid transport system substrate-binding protein
VQGSKTFQVLLLLLASSWLVSCGGFSSSTPTPIAIEAPVKPPVEVTRVVTQQVIQQFLNSPTPTPALPCASSHPQDNTTVTIGAILPLSSPGAILAGFSMQAALNIAVTEINEHGGINHAPIRLVTYDSAGSPARSAEFTHRLILLDCAVGIVGLYHNGDAGAAAEVAHQYGIPLIITEAGADEITARGYPEVFRLAPSYSMMAQMAADWLGEVGDYNGDGSRVAAIIAENSSLTTTMITSMRDDLVKAGIKTDLMGIDLPTTDFSPVIARLVSHDTLPDAIFICVKGEPALKLQAQLLAAGIGPQRSTLIVQNATALDSRQFWADVPKGNGTIVMRQGGWSSTLTQQGEGFAAKYRQLMGHWPESYAFDSYDAVYLLADTLRDARSWKGSELVAALEATHDDLSSGNITFGITSRSPRKNDQPAYLWHQWQDAQMLFLQYTAANQDADNMSVIWPSRYRSPGLQAAVVPTTP